MWSCGVLCYLLLNGKHPFPSENEAGTAKLVKNFQGYSPDSKQPEHDKNGNPFVLKLYIEREWERTIKRPFVLNIITFILFLFFCF